MYEEEVRDCIALLQAILIEAGTSAANIKYKAYIGIDPKKQTGLPNVQDDAGQYMITLKDGAYRNGAIELLSTLLHTVDDSVHVHPVRHIGGERMLMLDLVPNEALEKGFPTNKYCTNGELCMLLERGLEQMKLQPPEFTITPEREK